MAFPALGAHGTSVCGSVFLKSTSMWLHFAKTDRFVHVDGASGIGYYA